GMRADIVAVIEAPPQKCYDSGVAGVYGRVTGKAPARGSGRGPETGSEKRGLRKGAWEKAGTAHEDLSEIRAEARCDRRRRFRRVRHRRAACGRGGAGEKPVRAHVAAGGDAGEILRFLLQGLFLRR